MLITMARGSLFTRLFNDELHVFIVQNVQAVIGRARQLALEKHVLHAFQELTKGSCLLWGGQRMALGRRHHDGIATGHMQVVSFQKNRSRSQNWLSLWISCKEALLLERQASA